MEVGEGNSETAGGVAASATEKWPPF